MNLELFLGCNLLCNAAILWGAGRACFRKAVLWRLLCASLLGAGYAAVSLSVLPQLQRLPGKLLCAVLMTAAAYGAKPAKMLLRLGGMVAVMGFLLGGTGFGACFLLGSHGFGVGAFLLMFALGGGALCLLLPRRRETIRAPLSAEICLLTDTGERHIPAMLDTGNRLYAGGVPVIVVPRSLAGDARTAGAIACTTVAGETILPVLDAGAVFLNGRRVQAAIVVTPQSRDAALVPWELWRDGVGETAKGSTPGVEMSSPVGKQESVRIRSVCRWIFPDWLRGRGKRRNSGRKEERHVL